jgi:hypothetical protein
MAEDFPCALNRYDKGFEAMSRAAKSVFAFSFVFINGGLGLILAPGFVLSFLGFSSADFLFPRLLGMTMLVLAYYYIRAAWSGVADFFKWTVHARFMGVAFYTALVLFDIAPIAVLGFALMDFLGALWTQWALGADRRDMS